MAYLNQKEIENKWVESWDKKKISWVTRWEPKRWRIKQVEFSKIFINNERDYSMLMFFIPLIQMLFFHQ